MGGEYQELPSKNFCLTVPKNFVGEHLCFTKLLVSKKLMDKRGGGGREYHDFLSKSLLFHSAEKLRRGTLLCFKKLLVSKKPMDKKGE